MRRGAPRAAGRCQKPGIGLDVIGVGMVVVGVLVGAGVVDVGAGVVDVGAGVVDVGGGAGRSTFLQFAAVVWPAGR